MSAALRFHQVEPTTPGMKMNHGYIPAEARGKRVIVELRSGRVCGREQVSPTAPLGWAADGKDGCRWSLTGDDWDIVGYEVIG